MIDTFSIFYFGHQITSENSNLPFDEGGPELNASVEVGFYSLQNFVTAVETALNAAGANTYTVTVDRSSRLITVAADSTFSLLVSTGATTSSSCFELLGFTGADRTGAMSYEGDSKSGDQYSPQFKFQSYIDQEDWREASDASINESASGEIEVISFGTNRFFQMDIKFITDLPMDGMVIKNNPQGLADARSFFRDITRRGDFEFMPDINDRDTFFTVKLEKIPGSRTATGYKLSELFTRKLRDIYEVNKLVLRVVE